MYSIEELANDFRKLGIRAGDASIKSAGLEGLVAKRRNSRYEPGQRSGAWQKMRINRGQQFAIGGNTPSDRNFGALVFGYYKEERLKYVARTRNGFRPLSREQLFKKLRPLEIKNCPFANLPDARSGRWGAGLTAAKMEDCRWLCLGFLQAEKPFPKPLQ